MQLRDFGFLPSRSVRNSGIGRSCVRFGLIYVRKRVKLCASASFVCGRLFVPWGVVENVLLSFDLGGFPNFFIDSYTFSKIKLLLTYAAEGLRVHPSHSVRNSGNMVRSGLIFVRSGLIYVRKPVKRCALASFVCGRPSLR